MAFKFLKTFSSDAPPFLTGVTVGSGGVTEGDIVLGGGTNKVVKLAAVAATRARHFLCLKTAASGSTTNLILLTDDVVLACSATAVTFGLPIEIDFTNMVLGTTAIATVGSGGVALVGQYSEQTGPSTAVNRLAVVFVQGT